ncbi:MAG: hypothetical protein H6825_02890 [Planctomycetes bacterium]|nr:hypothetical protein [Planctomycetota bacterium]
MSKHLALPLVASLALALVAPTTSAADSTVPSPTFADPLGIDNPLAPFVPGRVKLYRGRTEGQRTASVDTCLDTTRSFAWHGQQIACRVLQEQEFESGRLVESTLSYLAQDDQGNVQLFGEVAVEYVDGVPVGTEADSWLVGGPQPGDDPVIRSFDEPAVFMPATLAPGDVIVQDHDPATLETLTVKAVDVTVRVSAGKFLHAVRVTELDDGEDTGPESRWIVPGIGTVKERAKRRKRDLIATSLEVQSAGDGSP